MAVTIQLPNTPQWWMAHRFLGRTHVTDIQMTYKFTGEIANWLKEHGHSAEFMDGLQRGFTISFEDPQVATLFKLTWL